MSTKRAALVWNREICLSSQHNPPGHIVRPPGRYVHTCPRCGRKTSITVRGPVWV